MELNASQIESIVRQVLSGVSSAPKANGPIPKTAKVAVLTAPKTIEIQEVQIPEIVEHGPAPGEPSGQVSAFSFQQGHPAFGPGVLVLADDHRVLVLPQVQKAAPAVHGLQQVLLHSQVEKGIEGPAFVGGQRFDHALT
jgi:hypothetical protein